MSVKKPVSSLKKQRRNILVMDDEKNIREMLEEMLDELGYSAVLTSNGWEVIHAYREALYGQNRFLAVIMDLVVPGGIGGKDAARQILDLDPSARIIVSSGYNHDPIVSNPQNYGFTGALKKPYKFEALEAMLKKVVGE